MSILAFKMVYTHGYGHCCKIIQWDVYEEKTVFAWWR